MSKSNAVRTSPTIPISQSALIARVRRRLAAEDDPRFLIARRPGRVQQELGTWYVVDCMGAVEHDSIDLARFGRELGALKPEEFLELPAARRLGGWGPGLVEQYQAQ